MPTKPRSALAHYHAAERLLAATEETPANAPMLALVHATLADVDPRKLRRHKDAVLPRAGGITGPGWYNDDDTEGDQR
jgi:hypothetical protein